MVAAMKTMTPDLTCSTTTKICQLPNLCSFFQYTALWNYRIMTQFNADGFYATVNIGSFAVSNSADNTCNIYVELLDQGSTTAT